MSRTYIAAINAPSGGGKTTITKRLKETLGRVEALYFDDRDYDADSDIIDICKWMNDGADVNKFNLDLLAEDIEQLLKKGLDFIILDYPFGYRHSKIAKYIDISIFIDTPLDIALGRRLLRDYKGDSEKDISTDIEFYLSRGRQTYISSRDTAIKDADIIVDGSKPVDEIVDFIKSKLYESMKGIADV